MKDEDKVILGANIYQKRFDVALLLPNSKREDKKIVRQYDGFDELQAWIIEKGSCSI
ncbi:MAG: hypothetical protein ACI87W_002765 [Halieaceae bacterium]|jgi:hypothetical protein